MARLSYEQSRCHCRSSGAVSFLRRMSGLRTRLSRCELGSCKQLRTWGSWVSRAAFRQIFSRHFCAMARHLAARCDASDEAWSGGGGVRRLASACKIDRDALDPFGFARGKLAGGGCPHISWAEGRLTCLSVRCLSSYLNFSASSSDKQAAVRFAGAKLDGCVRRP